MGSMKPVVNREKQQPREPDAIFNQVHRMAFFLRFRVPFQ